MDFQKLLQELATLKTQAAKNKRIESIKANKAEFDAYFRSLPATQEQQIKAQYPYLFQ